MLSLLLSITSYRFWWNWSEASHVDQFPQPVLYLSQANREVFVEAPEDIHSELEQKQATRDKVLQVQELTFTYPDAAQPSLRDISFDDDSRTNSRVSSGNWFW